MASSLLFKIFSFASLLFQWNHLPEKTPSTVPAIFVFGDSLADVGNNNDLDIVLDMKANFPFNGIDFPSKAATGRFSNGYNVIDYLAKCVGHEQSPPAFLSLTHEAEMIRGVNFASGGSGILDTTGPAIPFTTQIANFKEVVDVLVKQIGEKRTARLLSNSLFLITTGSNDMFGFYLNLGPQNKTENERFVSSLVDKFDRHLTTLYKFGARKFGVIGISHIGCIPAMRVANAAGSCVEDLNELARSFNIAVKAKLHHLKLKLHGMKYSYGNVYNMMSVAIAKPELYGYEELESACCGSGNFNGASLCTSNATLCPNRDRYLFWDRFHPTEIASKNTANGLYGGPPEFAAPINFRLLAKY